MNPKITYALLVLLFTCSSSFGQAAKGSATAHHNLALKELNEGDKASAEKSFFYSAKEYDFAPSWFELAKIEFDKNTVYSREKARNYIEKAIWIDPKDIEYRMLKAKLMEYFSGSMAYDIYEDIVKIDPDNTEALFNLGRIKEEDFYEYHNSFMRYEEASLSYNDYAYDDFIKAEGFFKKAIRSDSGRTDSYMHLSYMYSEAGSYEPGIPLLKKVVQIDSLNKNAYQFLGYLYYKTLSFDSSQSAYEKALNLMTEDERKEFQDSTSFILMGSDEPEDANPDSSVDQFWNNKDPLYLTKYNERLLEHYSRVAYSNLMFSVAKQNVTGWKSDRGEIMLRYGEPESRVRFRPYINAGGRTQMMMKTDVWVYKNKSFGFTDDYWTKNFRFSTPTINGRYYSQYGPDTYSDVQSLRRTDPEEYEPKFKGPVFTIPYDVAQFKNLNNDDDPNTQLYINYALDISKDYEYLDRYKVQHQSGLFLFDSKNNIIGQKVEELTYLGKERVIRFNPGEKYWINSMETKTRPDSLSLAFEVVRKRDGGVSTNHFKLLVKDYNGKNLELSDVVLASAIEKDTPAEFAFVRNNLGILPNPSGTFTHTTPVFLYYEVYNLKQDANHKADFEQRITLKKVTENSFIENIFSSIAHLFSASNEDEVTLTTGYQSFQKNTPVYLQLDMSGRRSGDYIITVTIEDKLAGREASSETLLKWR